MRIEPSSAAMTNQLISTIRRSGAGGVEGEPAPKTLGEVPPRIVDIRDHPELIGLFAQSGLVTRLKKRLNHLKRKRCKVVPAKGTVACIDPNDLVYLGVDFLAKYQDAEDVIAGVMAHEWGHACAARPSHGEIQELNWNQIFELRRAHESLADEICGRLLFLMGYTPEGMIKFLLKDEGKTHNLKYHEPKKRAEIIIDGFISERDKSNLARTAFPRKVYANDYHSILLDIA